MRLLCITDVWTPEGKRVKAHRPEMLKDYIATAHQQDTDDTWYYYLPEFRQWYEADGFALLSGYCCEGLLSHPDMQAKKTMQKKYFI